MERNEAVHLVNRPGRSGGPGGTGAPGKALSQRERRLLPLVARISRRFGMDPRLVRAVMRVESDFRPDAVSSAGAQGLMQLMPQTAKRFGVRDAFDVEQNIEGGVRYLRFLSDRYRGRLLYVLAAYHAGEGAVERARAVPPIPATRRYVVDVLEEYRSRGGQVRLPGSRAGEGPPSRPIRIYRDHRGHVVVTNVPDGEP